MPHLFSFANHASEQEQQFQHELGVDELAGKRQRRLSDLKKSLGGIWRRHHEPEGGVLPEHSPFATQPPQRRGSLQDHRRVIPSLPRPQTFKRQESEKRVNLLAVPDPPQERRAHSESRQRGLSASAARTLSPPKPIPLPSTSAPNVTCQNQHTAVRPSEPEPKATEDAKDAITHRDLPPLQIPDGCDVQINDEEEAEPDEDQNALEKEYEQRWILNLSMHFRDKSNREKFFVTYAQTPTKWRRLTVSLDYRKAPPGSLEEDLSTLFTQRDKSFRIYEAIRESLPDIFYYDTVTNLKLETAEEDGQLHVHVREDANEIINYPHIDFFQHIDVPRYRETDLEFIHHLSGFVYKVRAGGKVVIKKEIPGPDTIDEFLYEVNALDAVVGSSNVVQLEGLVTDESGYNIKGLLITYASRGALVDILWDDRPQPGKPTELPWHRREKWALQIVRGLANIHEAGFVQGDFTLSNIVIDEDDDAQIIDINRRGCPVGWEPPELSRLIDSGQRIGMCIGVKTDLFQLGMVLWALAEEVDEPERIQRPLPRIADNVPAYFRRIVETCLSDRPQGRQSAKRLVHRFPPTAGFSPPPHRHSVDFAHDISHSEHSLTTSHRSDKEYIDPDMAVTLDDVNPRNRRRYTDLSHFTSGQVTYVDPRDPESNPASTSYRFGSSGSWIVPRGRSGRRSSPYAGHSIADSSVTSLSRSRSPPSRSRRRCLSESSAGCGHDEKPVASARQHDVIDFAHDKVSTVEIPEPSDTDESFEPRPDRSFLDQRLAALRSQDAADRSPLVHTDSGFDKEMIEKIELGSATYAPYINGCKAEDAVPGCEAQGAALEDVPAHEVETPGSFHTPMTPPDDPLEPKTGIVPAEGFHTTSTIEEKTTADHIELDRDLENAIAGSEHIR